MGRTFRVVMFLLLAVIVGGAFVWWQCMGPATRIATAIWSPALAPASHQRVRNAAVPAPAPIASIRACEGLPRIVESSAEEAA
jgi:hypothetical protein